MVTGRSRQLTKQTGEYLVAAELCRRGFISTTFTGNVPIFDIITVNEKLKTIPIQVKTGSTSSWRFDAKLFLEISITNDIQTVKGKVKFPNPDLIYIFVRLREQNQDEFYICGIEDLQDMIYRDYSEWLARKKGKRPKKPKATDCAVDTDNLRDYRDNWDIIRKQLML